MSKSVGTSSPRKRRSSARRARSAPTLSHDKQGADLASQWGRARELQGKLNILWNVFRFPLEYMELDGYDPAEADLADGELELVDEWVLSRLQSVETEVTEAWADYRVSDAVNAVIEFVTQDVSRFYVKAVRDRMWEEADSASKRGAYATLATVLDEVIRLLAPIAPYLTERMYQTLDGSATTVHQLDYPEPDDGLRDPELERDVAVLRDVEEAAANARQQAGRKLRWPVPRVVVESGDDEVTAAVERLSDLIGERVNAREVTVTDAFDELVETAEPQMAEIGPAFGADAQKVMDAVQGATRAAVEGGAVAVDGEPVDLDDAMVEYVAEPPENVSGVDFDGGTVYVDTSLTPEIESEGYARDVIRRIQEMRKELDLDVEARIRVGVAVDDDRIAGFVDEHADLIAGEVRADEWLDEPSDAAETDGLVEEWDVEDVVVTIGIEPVA
ncbi:class I tRNA ligase family protein [Halorubrum sp. Ib24]|uniref:class I tRNA ligase family protein n=1 Tax=Halorubrum sp. Ib24 TaxID=1383850 RepID=UPI001F52CA82|nr:class I tRNA ligase family protein [Halorubrum sp. Ib24]